MAEDIENELDAILAGYKARVRQKKGKAAPDRKTEAAFVEAATDCFSGVIGPALHQMEQALNKRNVAAKVIAEGISARIYIPCPQGSCPAGYGIVAPRTYWRRWIVGITVSASSGTHLAGVRGVTWVTTWL